MNISLGCVLTNTGSHDPTDVAISFKIYRNVGVGDGEGGGGGVEASLYVPRHSHRLRDIHFAR